MIIICFSKLYINQTAQYFSKQITKITFVASSCTSLYIDVHKNTGDLCFTIWSFLSLSFLTRSSALGLPRSLSHWYFLRYVFLTLGLFAASMKPSVPSILGGFPLGLPTGFFYKYTLEESSLVEARLVFPFSHDVLYENVFDQKIS